MNIEIWTILEWSGALLSLIGAVLMAFKVKPSYPWILWIISNILCMFLFNHTQQYGLFLMNFGGIFINALGLYQWKQHEEKVENHVMKLLLMFVLIFSIISAYNIYEFILNPNIKNAEWIGSTLGLVGAFLLSSRHKLSFLCWIIWSFSNITLLIVTYLTQQYAFVLLQGSFMVTNILGAYHWIQQYRKTHSLDNFELPTQP